MNKYLLVISFLLLTACASVQTLPMPGVLGAGPDPTFTWVAPTTNCDGTPIVGSLTYNVYIAKAPATIPTITATTVPCGASTFVDTTKITPNNTAPITTTTYQTSLPIGNYSAGVIAIDNQGNGSSFVSVINFTVVLYPTGVPAVGLTVK
jgi:hypothetical protein